MSMIQGSIFDDKKFYKQDLTESLLSSPLANRMRPKNLGEFVGQKHLLGLGKPLRALIENDRLVSLILWGPPGVGKTTLAMIIANMTNSRFIDFSAVNSGIKEIKSVMDDAEANRKANIKTILFIDEIHRFNKAQQDAFLPYVESGSIILIGATTENPSFEINSALLSRMRVFVLNPLDLSDIVFLLKRAITHKNGYAHMDITIENSTLEFIANFSHGDVRTALNALELCVTSTPMIGGKFVINESIVVSCLNKKTLLYDKTGEEHYNMISALHKSMRNSDADAAVYWLSRMLEQGENPLYVARRLIRFASEDVGLADPMALQIAVAAYQASHYIGMSECTVNLAEAVIYLSLAPKSNSIYKAYEAAKADALKTTTENVPIQIRNAPTKLMSDLGYGSGYIYAHDTKDKIANIQCLPDSLLNHQYYFPTKEGKEEQFYKRLETIKDIKGKLK
ncbi:replication-associated recombination protein A [Clostridium oryzae]|uniref:Replication-associated recombination protein A n=1 Tax=Clostridium oryzae TaxID=1450648 RepID=A0A1V4I4X3_9CLOT|nr:replication-associated recombination protein A [Clostridium oryzae]